MRLWNQGHARPLRLWMVMRGLAMGYGKTLRVSVCVALLGLAPPCSAQGVGGLGAPTPQDTLENNLNALRGPSPGAPPRISVPTPQQSLDGNIDSLRPGGPARDRPTPQYYPPDAARATGRHPGADALLYGTRSTLAPVDGLPRSKSRKAKRKMRFR